MNTEILLKLAADRRQTTPELLTSNDFYGNAHTLKKFMGLPTDYSLKVILEHAVYIEDPVNFFWDSEMNSGMPVMFCANSDHAEAFIRLTGKPAFSIGPLVRYALPWRDGVPTIRFPSKKRVMIVPVHSSHYVDASLDHSELIAATKAAHPGAEMMALLYWKDILRGVHELYLKNNIMVRTAGHLYDTIFLNRLVSIFFMSSHIVTNAIGTHVFIATLLGRPVWFHEQDITYFGTPYCKTTPEHYKDNFSTAQLDLMHLFKTPRERIDKDAVSYVEILTGAMNTRSPKQLLKLVLTAEKLYQAQATEA